MRALTIAMATEGGAIVAFPKPTTWIELSIQEAYGFADLIRERADEI